MPVSICKAAPRGARLIDHTEMNDITKIECGCYLCGEPLHQERRRKTDPVDGMHHDNWTGDSESDVSGSNSELGS